MYLKLRNFMKTVTTAGTRENLTSSDRRVPFLMLQAEATNAGTVYVGDSTVSSTCYSVSLDSSDTLEFNLINYGDGTAMVSLKDIWLDVGESGDGVSVSYMEEK